MNTNRFRYRIIIALSDDNKSDLVAKRIAHNLTIRFGGCTILGGTGYWAEDGDQDLTIYSKPMVEPARVIEVVTVDDVTETIQSLVRISASDTSIPVPEVVGNWIHFEKEEIYCEHFQI